MGKGLRGYGFSEGRLLAVPGRESVSAESLEFPSVRFDCEEMHEKVLLLGSCWVLLGSMIWLPCGTWHNATGKMAL